MFQACSYGYGLCEVAGDSVIVYGLYKVTADWTLYVPLMGLLEVNKIFNVFHFITILHDVVFTES